MTFAWYAHLKNLADRPWYIAGAGESHRIHRAVAAPAENHAGSHHAGGVRAVRILLHAPTPEAGLSVGRVLHHGGGVLHIQGMSGSIPAGRRAGPFTTL